jgi:hypothetical protein
MSVDTLSLSLSLSLYLYVYLYVGRYYESMYLS